MSTEIEKTPLDKDWKYYTGLGLFVFSWIPWGMAPFVFLLDLPTAKAVSLSASLFLLGEVTFLLCIPLLGRPLIRKVKDWVMELLKRAVRD